MIDRITALLAKIAQMSKAAEMPQRLQTMPRVGPISALAVESWLQQEFRSRLDISACLGLVPRQHSTDGRQQLGRTLKTRDTRRLMIASTVAVIPRRFAKRCGSIART